ncbi:site-specific integrase [Ruminococcaceae bacterium OttesenSCG-928-A11]|nr:site-specific integrase [Ruminococcaceae bacterium OttesenSCG-928-A11]
MAKKRSNGEGSICKRSDGRYQGRYYVTLPDGSRKRRNLFGRTREDVAEKMRSEMTSADKGMPLYQNKNRTVEDMTIYFLEDIAPQRVRPTTLHSYKTSIKKHIIPAIGTIPLISLRAEHIKRMMKDMECRGVGFRAIRAVRCTISVVLKEAMKLEYIYRNVAELVDTPKNTPRDIVIWNGDQVAHFMNSIRGHKYYALFAMLFQYGLRRGEVLGLRWQDIDFVNNEIHIRQSRVHVDGVAYILPPKTKSGIRSLTLVPHIREALLEVKETAKKHKDDLIFYNKCDNPVDPGSLLITFHYLTREAGLPRMTIHGIRHTLATMLKDQGRSPTDAQKILGHADVYTTMQIYTHSSDRSQQEAMGGIADIITNKSIDNDSLKEIKTAPPVLGWGDRAEIANRS